MYLKEFILHLLKFLNNNDFIINDMLKSLLLTDNYYLNDNTEEYKVIFNNINNKIINNKILIIKLTLLEDNFKSILFYNFNNKNIFTYLQIYNYIDYFINSILKIYYQIDKHYYTKIYDNVFDELHNKDLIKTLNDENITDNINKNLEYDYYKINKNIIINLPPNKIFKTPSLIIDFIIRIYNKENNNDIININTLYKKIIRIRYNYNTIFYRFIKNTNETENLNVISKYKPFNISIKDIKDKSSNQFLSTFYLNYQSIDYFDNSSNHIFNLSFNENTKILLTFKNQKHLNYLFSPYLIYNDSDISDDDNDNDNDNEDKYNDTDKNKKENKKEEEYKDNSDDEN